MKLKPLLTCTFASALTMWVIAGLAHEVVFARFFSDAAQQSHKGPFIILIAYCILGFLMSYLFFNFKKSDRYLFDGIKFGAIIGILWVFPHGLAMAAAHGESISHEVLNGLWHVFEQAMGGLVIGYLFSKFFENSVNALSY